jgi:glutamine synthetase adenylyltransferase
MKKPDWQKLAAASADPARVRHFLALLAATEAGSRLEKYSADQMRVVVALLSGSLALGNLLVANPGWLSVLDIGVLKFPRRVEGLRREMEGGLKPRLEACDYAGALTELRRFKQREMLRIAARDLARLGDVVEITREISDLADVCLDAIHRAVRPAFSSGCGWKLAAHGILRARHGQAGRTGTQLQFGCGRAVPVQRRRGGFQSATGKRNSTTPYDVEPPVFQQARRGFRRRSFPRDGGRNVVPH